MKIETEAEPNGRNVTWSWAERSRSRSRVTVGSSHHVRDADWSRAGGGQEASLPVVSCLTAVPT
jgi:hypothetical protein